MNRIDKHIFLTALALFAFTILGCRKKSNDDVHATTKYIGLIGRHRNWHHTYDNYGILNPYNDTSFSIKVINDITLLGIGKVGMVNDTLVYSSFDTVQNSMHFDIIGFQYLHSESLIYYINNDSIYTQECYYGSTGGYGCNMYNSY